MILLVSLFSIIVVFVNGHAVPPALPEELLTDNDEQIDRLKRENFLESILKHIPFFHTSEPPNTEEDEEKKSREEIEGPVLLTSSSGILLSSNVTSSSHFLSSSTVSSSLFDGNGTHPSSSINVITPLAVSTSLLSTQVLNNTSISATLITIDIDHITASSVENVSSSVNISSSFSNQSVFDSIIALMMPVQMTSTSSLSSLSSILAPSPTVPTPPLSLSVSNSVSPSSSVSSTYFAAFSNKSIAMAFSSSAYYVQESFSEPGVTIIVESIEPSESRMPVLPNENGFGNSGTGGVPGRGVLDEEKRIGFVYTNIILPIVSGITGALLITFGIMLFRCCRRRKLKKVRYYGGRPNSDFVRLDRMNLLTDSSDDDY